MVRSAGLTLLALLLLAPAAGASTLGVSGNTAVFTGDASADRVQLMRFDDTQNGVSWYLVTDDGGITAAVAMRARQLDDGRLQAHRRPRLPAHLAEAPTR